MLTILKAIPAVLVLVIGLAGGGVLTGGIGSAWLTFIHDPALKREATATLTVEVRRAADAAQAAQASLQSTALATAQRQYQEQKAKDDAANADALEAMDKDINRYEAQKKADDAANPAGPQRTTVCGLNQSDLDFLGGVQDH